ncbi:MAG: YdcF family protein, partial [Actinobacteria bacterium]|nr:YdcF family protein [Actinomycetota bacterium]
GSEKRWLLVTSAAHLKRAYATFSKAGLNVDPIPVDYIFSQRPPIWSLAPLSSVPGWQGVIHEYVGGIYYSLRDWT